MRRGGALALATALATAILTACGSGGLFRQYEYEEEIYLSLDGSATVYVNSRWRRWMHSRGVVRHQSTRGSISRRSALCRRR
jgi:hypothetical protein